MCGVRIEVGGDAVSAFGSLPTANGPSVATQKQWEVFFSDPDLRALIEEALENNQELNIQLQEIIITLKRDVAQVTGSSNNG